MTYSRQVQHSIQGTGLRAAVTAIAILFALTVVATQAAQAQTFTVIHSFTGGPDGGVPTAGVIMDAAGNLYGTAYNGGLPNCDSGCGTVFKLTNTGSGWIVKPLYAFKGGDDGAYPSARVTIGPDGTLYGTTIAGGIGPCFDNNQPGCGIVFNLKPTANVQPNALGGWIETVLYRFQGTDGGQPQYADLIFDKAGDLYGTSSSGGPGMFGTVYELMPSNGSWTLNTLHGFNGDDGAFPTSGVIFDNAGNLYGVVAGISSCAYACGAVYELTPSGSGWAEKSLYVFQDGNDGGDPGGGVILDGSGNLYGGTTAYGMGRGGTVYELTPSGGAWIFNLLYSLTGGQGGGPRDSLVMDKAGNLYGAANGDGSHKWGSIFKLTPFNGGWTYTDLYDFTGGKDGGWPRGSLVLDANGNLYGTTMTGGEGGCSFTGCGVVFKITP